MRYKRDTVDRRNWRDRRDSSHRIELGGASWTGRIWIGGTGRIGVLKKE